MAQGKNEIAMVECLVWGINKGTIAAVGVRLRGFRSMDAHRIEMDMTAEFKEMGFLVSQDSREPPLKPIT